MGTRGRDPGLDPGRRRSNRPGISQADRTARAIDTLESGFAAFAGPTEGVSRRVQARGESSQVP